MKVLITGFAPFGGEKINPAFEAVKLLPDRISGAELIKREIPTEYEKAPAVLEEAIRSCRPDIVLCIGQAGGRTAITPEKVAINLADARIPDNAGYQPIDLPLHEDGETAYFATVPVKAMVQAMQTRGIPAAVSYSAGTFVCNAVMYHALYLTAKCYPNIKAGFIHVPFAEEQVAGKPEGTPFMELDRISEGLACAVEAAVAEN